MGFQNQHIRLIAVIFRPVIANHGIKPYFCESEDKNNMI